MDTKKRTKIFIEYAREEVIKLSEEVSNKYNIEIISQPTEALTMIKVREKAKNSLFYIGEVLVTETKVRINDQIGVGIVRGHNEELSKAMAIADAYYKLNDEDEDKWTEIFLKCEEEGIKNESLYKTYLANTKVDFNTMNE